MSKRKKTPIDPIRKESKPERKRSPSYSRRKGHSFEREIAIECRGLGYPEARRQLEYHADDAKGVDIQNVGPYKIQCKNTAKYVSLNTIKEVQCERYLGDIPILIAKAAGEDTLAVLHWSDLKRLIKLVNDGEN